MKIEEILKILFILGESSNHYKRVYDNLMRLRFLDNEEWKEIKELYESMNLTNAYDVAIVFKD